MSHARYSTEQLETQFAAIRSIVEPHQADAIQFAINQKRGLIEAPVGAGKTLIGLTAGVVMKPDKWLIVCSVNAIGTWLRELDKWFPGLYTPDEVVVVRGTPTIRQKLWTMSKGVIFICTFGTILTDKPYILNKRFPLITVDEAHRARNRKTKTFQALAEVSWPWGQPGTADAKKPSFIELTGTPGSKGIEHIWGYFHLIDPKLFRSYWKFVGTFINTADGAFGKIFLGLKNTEGFAASMAPFFFRVTEKDTKLEKVRRHIVPIELSPIARQIYNQFEAEMLAVLDDDIIIAGNTLAKTVKCRQFLCYPGQFFPQLGVGEIPPWIVDKIEDDDSEKMRHCIIFVPFRAAIQPYEDYFKAQKIFKDSTFIQLHGGLSVEEMTARVKYCNDTKGVAICTTTYAQSFEFPKIGTGFFAGYEYSLDVLTQAEGRFRRITSEQIANAYYPMFEGTVDDIMLSILDTRINNLKALYFHWKNKYNTRIE